MNQLINDFLNETEASASLPYCQIISPPNHAPTLKKGGFDMGFFLKKEQAEAAGFKPDENWKPAAPILGGEEQDGYICTHPRFVVISKSDLEIQQQNETGRWSFAGLAFENGQPTEWRRAFLNDRAAYKQVSRHLLLFLGADNKPLHTSPIQWTAKGGLSGALYQEGKTLIEQVNKCYAHMVRQAGQKFSGQLNDFAKAFIVYDFIVGWYKDQDDAKQAPYCVPSLIKMPTLENVGNSIEIDRKPRKIIFEGVSLSEVMISRNTEAGKLISEWFATYKEFAQPRRILPPIEIDGVFSNPQYLPNGEIKAMIGGLEVILPQSLEYALHTDSRYKAIGFVDGDVAKIRSVEAAPITQTSEEESAF